MKLRGFGVLDASPAKERRDQHDIYKCILHQTIFKMPSILMLSSAGQNIRHR